MKKQLIVSSIILALATTPVMASSTIEDTDNTSETIGFGTGVVLGGLIAGPVGAIVAGTVGVLIGQSHDRQELIEQADARLQQNNVALQTIKNDKQNLANLLMQSEQEKLQLSETLASSEKTLSTAEELEKLKLNLRFDVDSSQVESFYDPQIKHLAMMMQENPELSVNLSGYTDSSGSAESNLKLSQARIESVKLMLVNLGVDEQYITTNAFGESLSLQANRTKSSNFNERRVDVQLFAPEQIIGAEVASEDVGPEEVDDTAQLDSLDPLTEVSDESMNDVMNHGMNESSEQASVKSSVQTVNQSISEEVAHGIEEKQVLVQTQVVADIN